MCVQGTFSTKMEELMDARTRTGWPSSMCSAWRGIRLELAGELIQLVAGVVVALFIKNAGLAGFALVYAEYMTSVILLYVFLQPRIVREL